MQRHDVGVITTVQLQVQLQILLATCKKFVMVISTGDDYNQKSKA